MFSNLLDLRRKEKSTRFINLIRPCMDLGRHHQAGYNLEEAWFQSKPTGAWAVCSRSWQQQTTSRCICG
jgi:hypothetical protein